MTEKPKQVTLADALAGLTSGNQPTAVDVAMKLLDPTDAIMHTEILDPRTMNQLQLMIRIEKDPELKELWQAAYDARVVHMVSYKRKRETFMGKIFTGLQTFAMMGQPQQQDSRFKLKR